MIRVGDPPRDEARRLWQAQQRLYPKVISRLERATGPDRALDVDIAIVLSLVEDLAARGRSDPRCNDGSPVPRFTENLGEVEAYLTRALPRFSWAVEHGDAQVWDDPNREFWELAWMDTDGSTHMEKPPANAAIALTLALLRGADGLFD